MAGLPLQKEGAMKVLIVDHSPIIQERLKAMLSEVPQVETIGQAKDQFEAKKSSCAN